MEDTGLCRLLCNIITEERVSQATCRVRLAALRLEFGLELRICLLQFSPRKVWCGHVSDTDAVCMCPKNRKYINNSLFSNGDEDCSMVCSRDGFCHFMSHLPAT